MDYKEKSFVKILFLLGVGVFSALPIFVARAADYKYYEFSPDTANVIKISSYQNIYQTFYPSANFISAFDFWVDNTGSAGQATFELVDTDNNQLASQTININHINPSWGGSRLHISLPSSIAVINRSLYKIKIRSAMPNLRFYFSPKIKLVENNSPYPPPQAILDSAFLDSAAQDFYFKISLYTTDDKTPPLIFNVSSTLISGQSLILGFNSDKPIDYQIIFTNSDTGATQVRNWTNTYAFCLQGYSLCSANFQISPGAAYEYQIIAKDYFGNSGQINSNISIPGNLNAQNYGTNPNLSNPLPVISQAKIIYLDSQSVDVSWTTDIAADSKLVISLDPSANQVTASVYDSALELNHNLTTAKILSPQTNYYATLTSASNSKNYSSQNLNFTTLHTSSSSPVSSPTSTAPMPEQNLNSNYSTSSQNQQNLQQNQNQNISVDLPQPQITITQSQDNSTLSTLTIEWQAPDFGEPSNGYRIDIFDQNNKLAKQIVVPAGTHRIKIDLANNTYRIIVYANQGDVLVKISQVLNVIVYNKVAPFLKSTLFYILLGIAIIAGGIIFFVKFKLKDV